MKKLRIFGRILKQTGADRILLGFFVFFMLVAFIIWVREPHITTFGDALWYCYAVITTIGFGDILVTTHLSRILSVVLSIYAVLVIAIITGLVVHYFNQIVQMKQSETLAAIMDRLENLPNLSKEELENLSRNVKNLRRKR